VIGDIGISYFTSSYGTLIFPVSIQVYSSRTSPNSSSCLISSSSSLSKSYFPLPVISQSLKYTPNRDYVGSQSFKVIPDIPVPKDETI